MAQLIMVCSACQQVFVVPWYPEDDAIPPEMVKVIEHEEAHKENGETPGWDLKIKEEIR